MPASRSRRPSSASWSTTTATNVLVDAADLPRRVEIDRRRSPGRASCVPAVTSVIVPSRSSERDPRADELAGAAMGLEDAAQQRLAGAGGGGAACRSSVPVVGGTVDGGGRRGWSGGGWGGRRRGLTVRRAHGGGEEDPAGRQGDGDVGDATGGGPGGDECVHALDREHRDRRRRRPSGRSRRAYASSAGRMPGRTSGPSSSAGASRRTPAGPR